MMTKTIKSFVENADSLDTVVLIMASILIGGLIAIICLFLDKNRFRKSWRNILEALRKELRTKGYVMANLLIAIAMLKADKDIGKKIGRLEKGIEDSLEDSDFLDKLLDFIEGINDHNHTVILNSDYAVARETIKECIEVIDNHKDVGTFDDFAALAVRVAEAKNKLTNAVEGIERVLRKLRPEETFPAAGKAE